jgi:hypothetical protein
MAQACFAFGGINRGEKTLGEAHALAALYGNVRAAAAVHQAIATCFPESGFVVMAYPCTYTAHYNTGGHAHRVWPPERASELGERLHQIARLGVQHRERIETLHMKWFPGYRQMGDAQRRRAADGFFREMRELLLPSLEHSGSEREFGTPRSAEKLSPITDDRVTGANSDQDNEGSGQANISSTSSSGSDYTETAKPSRPPAWIDALLNSPVYARQNDTAGRLGLPEHRARAYLRAFALRGNRLTRAGLAQLVREPAMRVHSAVAALQRSLNVDGYEVLRVDETSNTVELNLELLKVQFHLEQCEP